MNKLAILLAAAPLAFFFACDDGGSSVDCTVDADCVGVEGLDNPVCDPTLLICVNDDRQCEEDSECQATDIGGSAACEADGDCADDEACIPGADGEAHCVLEGGNCVDDGFDAEETTADDVDGNSVTFCVDVAVSCNADGDCEGGTFE